MLAYVQGCATGFPVQRTNPTHLRPRRKALPGSSTAIKQQFERHLIEAVESLVVTIRRLQRSGALLVIMAQCILVVLRSGRLPVCQLCLGRRVRPAAGLGLQRGKQGVCGCNNRECIVLFGIAEAKGQFRTQRGALPRQAPENQGDRSGLRAG